MMGQRYLLLGGSSELCIAFLHQHVWQKDDVIVAQYFHNKDALEGARQNIVAKMELWDADFGDEESTREFAGRLKEKLFVPTHILHVPAIPIENQRFADVHWRDADQQVHVQCRSLWMVLQAVIKGMAKAKSGKIILGLSSCTMNVPPKFLASYVMAKYALLGLGKALATEFASKGIQVNMISPSMMETKFLKKVYSGVVEQSAGTNPMGRNASPKDVAGLIEYLFSDSNGFITGGNFPVTGGEAF